MYEITQSLHSDSSSYEIISSPTTLVEMNLLSPQEREESKLYLFGITTSKAMPDSMKRRQEQYRNNKVLQGWKDFEQLLVLYKTKYENLISSNDGNIDPKTLKKYQDRLSQLYIFIRTFAETSPRGSLLSNSISHEKIIQYARKFIQVLDETGGNSYVHKSIIHDMNHIIDRSERGLFSISSLSKFFDIAGPLIGNSYVNQLTERNSEIEKMMYLYRKNWETYPEEWTEFLVKKFVSKLSDSSLYIVFLDPDIEKVSVSGPENIIGFLQVSSYQSENNENAKYLGAVNLDGDYKNVFSPFNTLLKRCLKSTFRESDEIYGHAIVGSVTERLWKQLGFEKVGEEAVEYAPGKIMNRSLMRLTKEEYEWRMLMEKTREYIVV